MKTPSVPRPKLAPPSTPIVTGPDITPQAAWRLVGGFALLALLLPLGNLGSATRAMLATWAREGTEQTFVGHEGWLFPQSELHALSGPSPLLATHGAESIKDQISRVAAQVKAAGATLVLVPVPMKATIYPEYITGAPSVNTRRSAVTYEDGEGVWGEAPVMHPDEDLLYAALRDVGVDVIDIRTALLELKDQYGVTYRKQLRAKVPDAFQKDVYLRQDRHWTFEAMQQISKALALKLREKYPKLVGKAPLEMVRPRAVTGYSEGDLVQGLKVAAGQVFFEEEQTVVGLDDLPLGGKSPLLLVGDSFAQIYDAPKLGFAADGAALKAGMAQQLSLFLGAPLAFTPAEGVGEATEQIAAQLEGKKLVLWVISTAELL